MYGIKLTIRTLKLNVIVTSLIHDHNVHIRLNKIM